MPSAERPRIDPADYADVEIDDPDNPEWTGADFARARSAADLPPDARAAMAGAAPRSVTLELDARVIGFFESQGPDWRTRMADTLADAARAKRRA